MGGGTSGNPSATGAVATLKSNLAALTRHFPPSRSGYFGVASREGNTRLIRSNDPQKEAKRFFSTFSKDASYIWEERPGVFRARFQDGTHIVFRLRSGSDGSPVVNFKLSRGYLGIQSNQKIHFTRR